MRHAAGKKPCLRIDELGSLRPGTAMLGLDVAAQRVFENREEELELAAGRIPSCYVIVILNRQQRIVFAAVSLFASSVPALRRLAKIVLIPHFLLVQKNPAAHLERRYSETKTWISTA